MDRLPEMETPRHEVLSSLKQVREMLKATERAQLVALDIQAEGTGAVGATLIGISLCFEPGHVYHAPLGPEGTDSDAILRELRPLLGVSSAPKVMHDSKPGLVVLAQRGVEPGAPSFDTLLAAFLLDGKAYGLEDPITERLGLTAGERKAGEGQERTRNLCARVDAVLRLGGLLEAELEERGQLAYLRELEMQLVPVLADMELAGVAVDTTALEDLSLRLAGKLRDLEREIAEVAAATRGASVREAGPGR